MSRRNKKTRRKSEFRELVKGVLAKHSVDNNAQAINMTSEFSQDLVAKDIEKKIKEKFHIFRINRVITGD